MRHKKAGVKLNRTTSHRQAMFRNMVTSLFKHERIRTTDVKARELRRWADHIITLAKRGDLHARRQVLAIVREKEVAHKLFAEAQSRFGNQSGGYTRIVKIGLRPGDAAPISLIELVAIDEKAKIAKKKGKGSDKKKGAAAKPVPATGKETAKSAEPEVAQPPPAAAAPVQVQSQSDDAEGVIQGETAETAGDERPDASEAVQPDDPEMTDPAGAAEEQKRDPQ